MSIQSIKPGGGEGYYEVKRVIGPNVHYWSVDPEETEASLIQKRRVLLDRLNHRGHLLLNTALHDWFDLPASREGLTFGWATATPIEKNEFCTWSSLVNGTFEITFHNVIDISHYYKTEEEL